MIDAQRMHRIRAALAAYAYEIEADPIMTDGDYDALCALIDPTIKTGNAMLDQFFAREFTPDSGLWIYKHPEPDKLRAMFIAAKSDGRYFRRGSYLYEIG